MQYYVCCVFDVAAGVFSRPFFTASAGLALRSFTDEVNRADVNNPMNTHPGDFQLFHLGSFDDESGEFKQDSRPTRVCLASDVKV